MTDTNQTSIELNKPEVETVQKLKKLIGHGYKTIDILVRKDGKDYVFEGDWIARLLREWNFKMNVQNNPTRLQLFLRKKIWFKSFTGSHSIGFSLAGGFCRLDLRKHK